MKYLFLFLLFFGCYAQANINFCSFYFILPKQVIHLNNYARTLYEDAPEIVYAKDFVITHSNARVEQAEVILLGENHADLLNVSKMYRLIEAFGGGNYVLSEIIPEYINALHRDQQTNQSLEGVRELRNLSKQQYSLDFELLLRLYEMGDTVAPWDIDGVKQIQIDIMRQQHINTQSLLRLHKVLKKSPNGITIEGDFPNLEKGVKVSTALIALRKKIISYFQHKRDVSMVDKIHFYAKKLGPGKKLFIVAGKSHFEPGGYVLNQVFKDYKAVVLLPKTAYITHLDEYNAEVIGIQPGDKIE